MRMVYVQLIIASLLLVALRLSSSSNRLNKMRIVLFKQDYFKIEQTYLKLILVLHQLKNLYQLQHNQANLMQLYLNQRLN